MSGSDVMDRADYSAPVVASDGQWGTLGGVGMRESLTCGSVDSAVDLLIEMGETHAVRALEEIGFNVPAQALAGGLEGVLNAVRPELKTAADLRVDGFGLAGAQAHSAGPSFAAKNHTSVEPRAARIGSAADAAALIQRVMQAEALSVELTGEASATDRASLVMVAGQGLAMGIQGFAFDGIDGKYAVPLSMAEVGELHRGAARCVAEESARVALGSWARGEKVAELHEWVPDSVQRLLLGAVSLTASSAVVHAIEGGSIGRHASEIGTHEFARLLAEQGFDVNAKTVGEQAEDLGVELVTPDRNRGQYVGKVVGRDHRAALIRFNRNSAIELPLAALDKLNIPAMGDTVRVGFKAGVMSVSVAERPGREGSER